MQGRSKGSSLCAQPEKKQATVAAWRADFSVQQEVSARRGISSEGA